MNNLAKGSSSNESEIKQGTSEVRQSTKELRFLTLCIFLPVTVISIIYLLFY